MFAKIKLYDEKTNKLFNCISFIFKYFLLIIENLNCEKKSDQILNAVFFLKFICRFKSVTVIF